MTTLFKKLSITTLTLAIASGIVFSVGSSEPSTFEGEATTTYSVTFSSSKSTLTSGVALANTTQSAERRKLNIYNFTGENFPLVVRKYNFATDSPPGYVEFANNLTFEIKNMLTISVDASSYVGPIRAFYSTDTSLTNMIQFSNSNPVPISGNYFSLRYFYDNADVTINSITITYSC